MTSVRTIAAFQLLACMLVMGARSQQESGTTHSVTGDESKTQTLALPLDSMDDLELQGMSEAGAVPVKIQANVASYRGRRAVRIVNDDGPAGGVGAGNGRVLAIVKKSVFKDGAIEAEVAGFPRPGAKPGTRGFIGIAFRVKDHGSRYEAFYLRMTNGRANDQLQRNHSAQYVSHPDFSWNRLREENPGVHESYVDLDAGAWTRIKIVVAGTKAQLFVNGAEQPCLIVNDLKLGDSNGQVALWTGSDTEAYFSNLTVK
jgi:3-keto-disaccharide hydrolase